MPFDTTLTIPVGAAIVVLAIAVIIWRAVRAPTPAERSGALPLYSIGLGDRPTARRAPARASAPSVPVAGSPGGGTSTEVFPVESFPPDAPAAPARRDRGTPGHAAEPVGGGGRGTASRQVSTAPRGVPAQASPVEERTSGSVGPGTAVPGPTMPANGRPGKGTPARGMPPASLPAQPAVARAGGSTESAQALAYELVPGEVAESSVEGHVVRFSVPQDGTLQVLPGRLEVASGRDAGREIRFVRLPGPEGTTFTFGRSEGPPYRHIQLREATVSRSHARLEYAGGEWLLTNLSTTNPVVRNGEGLAPGAQVPLADGDRLEMGEVVFSFRSR
jgi:hypothetical protein